MIRLILATLLITTSTSTSAFAAPGVQEPVHPNYKDPYDMVGLCAPKNINQKNHYMASGHCLTILETLNDKECAGKKLEEIRLRFLAKKEDMQAAKLKNQDSMHLDFQCTDKSDPNNDIYKLAEDPKLFSIVMMQLFSLIAIEESKWRVLNNGQSSESAADKCTGSRCGLLGLDKKAMTRSGAPYMCGCEIKNKDNKTQADPTMDGHLNLRCGITMALFAATEEKNTSLLGGGKPKGADQAEDSRSGFAKIFKSLEDVEDSTPDKVDTTAELIKEKMKTYCETQAFATKNVNEWKREIPDQDASKVMQ